LINYTKSDPACQGILGHKIFYYGVAISFLQYVIKHSLTLFPSALLAFENKMRKNKCYFYGNQGQVLIYALGTFISPFFKKPLLKKTCFK